MSSSRSFRFSFIDPNSSEGFEEFSNPREEDEELNRYINFLFVVSDWLLDFIEILNKCII